MKNQNGFIQVMASLVVIASGLLAMYANYLAIKVYQEKPKA